MTRPRSCPVSTGKESGLIQNGDQDVIPAKRAPGLTVAVGVIAAGGGCHDFG